MNNTYISVKSDSRDKDDAEYDFKKRQYRRQTKQFRQLRKNNPVWRDNE